MKRCLTIVLLLGVLMLTACGEQTDPNKYSLEHKGKAYYVELNENGSGGTVTVDGDVYEFTVAGHANNMEFNVTYPNGSTFWWQSSGNMGHGGWSEDYDEERYISGHDLWDALELRDSMDNSGRAGNIFLGLIITALGILNAGKPEFSWYLSHGWHYKNAEPSEVSLIVIRIGGVFVIIIGLIYLLFA